MKYGWKSHPGLIRENNEDSLWLVSPLFAVADGMGGANAGEIASFEALQIFGRIVQETLDQGNGVEFALKKGVSAANTRIWQLARESSEKMGMGTTLTGVYLADGKLFAVQVGDSRLYLFRYGKLLQLTEDQTVVRQLITAGAITPEEAQVHPRKNFLTQALGISPVVQPGFQKWNLNKGDKLLLCTDGLTKMVTDGEMAVVFAEENPQKIADTLVERALQNGGRDNISVVVITELTGEV